MVTRVKFEFSLHSLMRGDPDAVIQWGRFLLGVAMLLTFLCIKLGVPGIITSVFLVSLGALGDCWRITVAIVDFGCLQHYSC